MLYPPKIKYCIIYADINKPDLAGVTGQGLYADGMVEHDGHVGQLLDKLDALGITENTIVMYATDNGAELML